MVWRGGTHETGAGRGGDGDVVEEGEETIGGHGKGQEDDVWCLSTSQQQSNEKVISQNKPPLSFVLVLVLTLILIEPSSSSPS